MAKYSVQTIRNSLSKNQPVNFRIISPTGRFVESHITLRSAQNKVRTLNELRRKVWGK